MRFLKMQCEVKRIIDFDSPLVLTKHKLNWFLNFLAKLSVRFLVGVKWLQFSTKDIFNYSAVSLNIDNLSRYLIEEQRLFRRKYNLREICLLIGPDGYQTLFGENLNDIPSRFEIPFIEGQANQFAGMNIIVLPWLANAICVPKEYIPFEVKIQEKKVPMDREELKKWCEEHPMDREAARIWNSF